MNDPKVIKQDEKPLPEHLTEHKNANKDRADEQLKIANRGYTAPRATFEEPTD